MIKKYGRFTLFSQFFEIKDIFKFHLIKREWKFFWQRFFNGFDDSELWNLDLEINEFAYSRVKRLFEIDPTGPPYKIEENRFLSKDEWKIIKGKILYALSLNRIKNPKAFDCTQEERKKINEGLSLFQKYYRTFGW